MIIKNNFEISLDKFINFALYDKKKGYYMQKSPFGRKGDFITAPNISRMFSEMIAIWILGFWENLGNPKKINLVELGAGNGEMMKILLETFKKFPVFFNSAASKIVFIDSSLAISRNPHVFTIIVSASSGFFTISRLV